jgi:serine/threonine protein kinase/streptogramin lyase
MADRVGQQLGHYRLMRLIGQGAFAEVYLGEHIHLGNRAAIKVLHAHLASRDEVEQFRTEARQMVELIHTHIVRVLDFGIEAGTPYLVMDYAPNGTLRQRHPRGTLLSLETILPYVHQIAGGLQYAHDEQLIHRDIKPENLLLGRRNGILISDFGIATVSSTRYNGPQNVAGTVSYMAPEQLQGQPQYASDQYALGIVVYEWLTGTVPFRGSWLEVASQHSLRPPPPLRGIVPTIPPAVEDVVLMALAKDPSRRFSSIWEFATALKQASANELYWSVSFDTPATPTPLPPGATMTPAPFTLTPTPATGFHTPPPASSFSTPVPTRGPGTPPPAAGSSSINFAPTMITLPQKGSGQTRKKRPRTRSVLAIICLVVVLLGSAGTLAGLGFVGKGPLSFLGVGRITEFALPTVESLPDEIAAGLDGNLWFTLSGSRQIGRITPGGVITQFSLPASNGLLHGIAAGPDGNLWFTEMSQIGSISPTGSVHLFPVPDVEGITAGPDSALWFTEPRHDAIGRITPTGEISAFPLPTPDSAPTEITAGPDGNLWFTDSAGNQIGRISPSGGVDEFPLPTPGNTPRGITAGPDGNLWFTEGNNTLGRITPTGRITEFPLPTPESMPAQICTGPDGNLWFTEWNNNMIGRITPSGTITEFPIPSLDSRPNGITAGPNGTVWFTENGADQIARILSGG